MDLVLLFDFVELDPEPVVQIHQTLVSAANLENSYQLTIIIVIVIITTTIITIIITITIITITIIILAHHSMLTEPFDHFCQQSLSIRHCPSKPDNDENDVQKTRPV